MQRLGTVKVEGKYPFGQVEQQIEEFEDKVKMYGSDEGHDVQILNQLQFPQELEHGSQELVDVFK